MVGSKPIAASVTSADSGSSQVPASKLKQQKQLQKKLQQHHHNNQNNQNNQSHAHHNHHHNQAHHSHQIMQHDLHDHHDLHESDQSFLDARKNKRVGKACDSCRIKKTKCDGKKPCTKCLVDNKLCTYSEKRKPKEKQYPQGYVDLLESRLAILQKVLQSLVVRSSQGHDVNLYLTSCLEAASSCSGNNNCGLNDHDNSSSPITGSESPSETDIKQEDDDSLLSPTGSCMQSPVYPSNKSNSSPISINHVIDRLVEQLNVLNQPLSRDMASGSLSLPAVKVKSDYMNSKSNASLESSGNNSPGTSAHSAVYDEPAYFDEVIGGVDMTANLAEIVPDINVKIEGVDTLNSDQQDCFKSPILSPMANVNNDTFDLSLFSPSLPMLADSMASIDLLDTAVSSALATASASINDLTLSPTFFDTTAITTADINSANDLYSPSAGEINFGFSMRNDNNSMLSLTPSSPASSHSPSTASSNSPTVSSPSSSSSSLASIAATLNRHGSISSSHTPNITSIRNGTGHITKSSSHHHHHHHQHNHHSNHLVHPQNQSGVSKSHGTPIDPITILNSSGEIKGSCNVSVNGSLLNDSLINGECLGFDPKQLWIE